MVRRGRLARSLQSLDGMSAAACTPIVRDVVDTRFGAPIEEEILTLLDEALLVRELGEPSAVWSNHRALGWRLLDPDDRRLAPEVLQSADEHSERRRQYERHGARAPACRFPRGGRVWYLRTARFSRGRELIVCTRSVMRELELLQTMQRLYQLTDRQADVLRYMLRGASTQGTADALALATRTVRKYQDGLRSALGVESNYAVVRIAEEVRWGRR